MHTQAEHTCIHLRASLFVICICAGLTLFICVSRAYTTLCVYAPLSVGKGSLSCRRSVWYLQGFLLHFGFFAVFHGCKIMPVRVCITYGITSTTGTQLYKQRVRKSNKCSSNPSHRPGVLSYNYVS